MTVDWKWRVATATCIVFSTLASAVLADEPARGALVVSVDGLRGDYVCDADRYKLKIPTLRGLMARGSYAEGVLGVFPSVTYPSHTTLMSGCTPARHGVLANEVFDPPTVKSSGRWYWNYSDICVPTLLSLAHDAGWKTAAVGWPVTVGAPADYLMPEVWLPHHFEQRLVEMSRHAVSRDLIAGVLTRFDLGPSTSNDEILTRTARYIVQAYQPRLMLLHLVGLDHEQHSHGPGSRECLEELEKIDALIGDLLASYSKAGFLDRTIVAIVSDHGFLEVHKTFNVNVVLRRAGLIRFASETDKTAESWDAVGWTAGGSCAIVLNDPTDEKVVARVRKALEPYAGRDDSPIRRILDRKEIESRGSNPRAVLMLDAGDGFTFSQKLSGEPVGESGVKGMHGQLPERPGLEAALILAGPGIRRRVRLHETKMIDIAPTIATAVGLTMKDADGRPAMQYLDAQVGSAGDASR